MSGEERRQVLAALAGGKSVLETLPADSPLQRHRPLAEAALQAYCQGDDEALQAALAKLPFRSPYRDLRYWLNALKCYPHAAADAFHLLERLAPDSPFVGPAKVARALFEGDRKGLGPQAREFVRAIAGKGGEKAQPKQLFSTLLAEAKKQPDTPGLQAGLLALLGYYPAGKNAFAKVYGPADRDELLRMEALLAERKKDLDTALNLWEELSHRYRRAGRQLHAARVLWHMVGLLEKANYPELEAYEDLLSDAVSLDPRLRDAWLKLAEVLHKQEDQKGRGRVLDQALKHFPDDPAVLQAAADAAIDREVFKKAARLTRQLLEIDPINRRARQRLLDAHLRHARKQVTRGKFDLAAREISQAREWVRETGEKGRVAVLEALLDFLRGVTLEPDLSQVRSLLPSPLLECVLATEVHNLGFPPRQSKPYLKQLRQVLDHKALTIDQESVTRLLDLLLALAGEESSLDEVVKTTRPFLKKGLQLDWSEEERIALLEKLLQLRQYQLLRDGARASPAWKKRPGQRHTRPPALVYFDLIGKCAGDAGALSYSDRDTLEGALEYAHQINQPRWVARIDKLLEDYEESRSILGPPSGGELNPIAMLEQLSRETAVPMEKLLENIFGGGRKK